MSFNSNESITLIELIVAVTILSLIVIGLSNIDTFSRFQIISSDRRAKLQHDAAYVLEHMAKEIGKAIGDNTNPPSSLPVDTSTIGGDTAIQVWIDFDRDGRRGAADREIAYRFTGAPTAYQIKYCPECQNIPCTNCNPNWNDCEILSSKITAFTPTYSSINNYIDIQLTACWDPNSPITCGTSVDNPAITLQNYINMPAVSVK